MNLDEFEKYIEDLEIKTNKVFRNMDKIIAESERVSNIAKNSEEIFDKLETEFKKQTGFVLHPKSWTQDWRCSFYE